MSPKSSALKLWCLSLLLALPACSGGGDGSAPDGECSGGRQTCAGRCVSTADDPAHCGGCDRACNPGQACLLGKCVGETTAGDGGPPPPADASGPAPDVGVSCPGGQRECGGICVDTTTNVEHCGGCGRTCGGDQICSGSNCAGLPDSCPPEGCPSGSYCDLNEQRCVVGCLDDDGCGGGQICEQRKCVTGCRADGACAAGQICVANKCVAGCRDDAGCQTSGTICEQLSCVPGCRNDPQCPAGQICEGKACRPGCRDDGQCNAVSGEVCDPQSLTCRAGCRDDGDCPAKEMICDEPQAVCVAGCADDTDCNAGRICEGVSCRPGCRDHDTCPVEQHCDPSTLTCLAGCAGLAERCPVGEACVKLVSGASECRAACYGYECNGADWTCFAREVNYSLDKQNARCRQTCKTDGECDPGYKCTWFRIKKSTWASDALQLCAKPCSVTGSCSSAQPNLANYYTCACDTAEDLCKVDGTGTMCYQMDPSYGL